MGPTEILSILAGTDLLGSKSVREADAARKMEAAVPNSLPVYADPIAQRRRWRLLAFGVMLLGCMLLGAAARFEVDRGLLYSAAIGTICGGYVARIWLDQTVHRPGNFSLALAVLGLLPGGIGLALHMLGTRPIGEAVLAWFAVVVLTTVSFFKGALVGMVLEGALLLG